MNTLKDIENRKDIEDLLYAFYRKVFTDQLIGHFFTIIVPLDLEKTCTCDHKLLGVHYFQYTELQEKRDGNSS